jgi:hypothetical protein
MQNSEGIILTKIKYLLSASAMPLTLVGQHLPLVGQHHQVLASE